MALSTNTKIANRRGVIPVGSIIAFYEFETDPLIYDFDTWKLCNGQTVEVKGVGSVELPDLSGRCLVGYGTDKAVATQDTDGNQDIDTEPFTHNLTGVKGSGYNFEHTHTLNHHHSLGSHSHSLRSHVHSISDHKHSMYYYRSGYGYYKHYHYYSGGNYHAHRWSYNPSESTSDKPYTYRIKGGVPNSISFCLDSDSNASMGRRIFDWVWDDTGWSSFYTEPRQWNSWNTEWGYVGGQPGGSENQWWTGYMGSDKWTGTPSPSSTRWYNSSYVQDDTSDLQDLPYVQSPAEKTYNTNAALSSVDLRPRSVRVRFLMRVE